MVVDLLRLATGDFTCLVAMGYFSTVLDTLGVLFSYCLMVWGVEGFSETLCGGLSENGLHTIYLNV